MNRRDFIRLVSGVPLLGALALEMKSNPSGYEKTGVYQIKSKGYVIGIGNSSVAKSVYDTDLQGDLRAYASVDSVKVDDKGQLVFVATFGLNDANFHWNEMALFANGRFVSRMVTDQGVKNPDTYWTINYRLELL